MLAQLDLADYLPPPAWHDAVYLLTAASSARGDSPWLSRPALGREFEEGLRTEIDEFSSRFFHLSPTERLSQWNELSPRTRAWPSLRARLALLKPGLALESIPVEFIRDERAADLAQSLVRLFPLEAACRRTLIGRKLASMVDEPHEWEKAARRLSAEYPEMTLLVPEFVEGVMTLCDHERKKNLLYDARHRETDEDAEWRAHNFGYYLELLRADRTYYWIVGIFGAIPLLVLIIAALYDLAKKERPAQPASTYETVDKPRTFPARQDQIAPRSKRFQSPANSKRPALE